MGFLCGNTQILPETGAGVRLQPWLPAPVGAVLFIANLTLVGACAQSNSDVSIRYLDAPPRAEDIVQSVDGGPVFVSAIATSPEDTEAGLYLLDALTGDQLSATVNWSPEDATETFAGDTCGLVAPERIAPHGIAIRSSSETEQLLVVVHAPLEAILVYDIAIGETGTELNENTCLSLPEGVFANAVTAFSSLGLAVTKMFDPREGEPFERFASGAITGSVLTWSASTGWESHDHIQLSGPNGLLWDAENSALIVAEWARRQIVRIPVDADTNSLGHATQLSAFSFMPDNLRWADDGVLVTGQASSISEGHACITAEAPCPTGFEIVRVDPVLGEAEILASIAAPGSGMASVAAPVNGGIWVGSVSGNEIAEVIVSSKTTLGGVN